MIQFISIVTIITAAQALLLFVHFSFKKKGIKVLNYLLALLTFGFSFLLVNTYFNLTNFSFFSNLYQDISNNIMWFLGPALYLYTIYDSSISKKKIYTHIFPYLVPFFLDMIFDWPKYDAIIPFAAYIQMCIYLISALIFSVKNYKNQKVFFSWIQPSIIVFLLIVVINFALTILSLFNIFLIPNHIQLSLVVLLSFPIFYISYKEMNTDDNFGLVSSKYKTSPIAYEKSKMYIEIIMNAMEKEKAYKDMNLNLASFSNKIDIPSKYISQTINQARQMSFPDFINYYRIKDVKRALINPKNKDFTIIAIAQESGFKSGSRFNTLFKKETGVTPSEYRMNKV